MSEAPDFTLTPSPADPQPRGNYGYNNRVSIACRDAYERDFVSELDGFDIPKALMDAILEIERLDALINNPHTADFLTAVQCEAAHQRERWHSEHDAGKTDADWFWLVGHLAGKAISKPEKQLHHIITAAAALLNWHANKTRSDTSMRPGIDTPNGEQP